MAVTTQLGRSTLRSATTLRFLIDYPDSPSAIALTCLSKKQSDLGALRSFKAGEKVPGNSRRCFFGFDYQAVVEEGMELCEMISRMKRSSSTAFRL